MSIGDLTRRVVTIYSAQTDQLIDGMGKVAAKGAELGSKIAEGAKSANEGLDHLFESATSLQGKFETLKKVGEFMWEGYKDGLEDARNASTAFGVDLEALTKASHGLVTENDLLAFSAKGMKSAYGNTQEDLEMAQKLMLKLERQGVGVAEATKAVTDALVEGKTRGLEPYGIVVDRHVKGLADVAEGNETLTAKMEIHNRFLKMGTTLTKDMTDAQDEQGEAMGRSVVTAKNAWDDMKKSIGQLTEAMAPLISALAGFVERIASVTAHLGGIHSASDVPGASVGIFEDLVGSGPDLSQVKGLGGAGDGDSSNGWLAKTKSMGMDVRTARLKAMQAQTDAANAEAGIEAAAEKGAKVYDEAQKKRLEAAKKAQEEHDKFAEMMGQYNKALSRSIEEERKKREEYAKSNEGMSRAYGASLAMSGQLGAKADDGSGPVGSYAFADQSRQINDIENKRVSDLTESWRTRAAASTQRRTSFLEQTFGKVSDFDLYKKAFDSLSGATSAALGAWIDGSMSAGQAFKKFIADALKGLASQMLIESLKHAAYALGSLAFYDYGGAARHAAAAAAFAVGAGAAAVGARELGGTASASAGGGSASASSAGGGSGSSAGDGGSGTGPIIVYGDSFSDDSPRMRAIKAQKMVTKALGSAAMSNS